MQELTVKEQKWVDGLQKYLDKCPSDRLGFYTIGDNTIFLYNLEFEDEILAHDHDDLARILKMNGWGFDEVLFFPNAVEGVCG